MRLCFGHKNGRMQPVILYAQIASINTVESSLCTTLYNYTISSLVVHVIDHGSIKLLHIKSRYTYHL